MQLMREFADGFVAPLARALRFANSDLNLRGFLGDGMTPPIVTEWPDRAVPDDMYPPRNEHLVIDLDEFPTLYETLVNRSTIAERTGDKAVEARTAVIDARFLDTEATPHKPAPPIAIRTTWSPDPALLLGGATPRTTATFDVAFRPEDVLRRADAWISATGHRVRPVHRRPTFAPTSTTTHHVDPVELAERRKQFRIALSSALDSAEPLVQIDPALLAILHQSAEVPRRAVPGELPFRDHPVEADVREILASKLGRSNADARRRSRPRRPCAASPITATLGAAHDPLVFSSITAPLVAGWNAAAQSAPGRTNFWNNRRARPIAEFIPASQEVILAMTRGWFTGHPPRQGRPHQAGHRPRRHDGIVPLDAAT